MNVILIFSKSHTPKRTTSWRGNRYFEEASSNTLLFREYPSQPSLSQQQLDLKHSRYWLESLLEQNLGSWVQSECASCGKPQKPSLAEGTSFGPCFPSVGWWWMDTDAPCVLPAITYSFSLPYFYLLCGPVPHFWPRCHKGATSPVFHIHFPLVNAFLKYLILLTLAFSQKQIHLCSKVFP